MEDHAIQSGFKAYATIAKKNGAAKSRRRNKIRPPSRLRGIAPVCRGGEETRHAERGYQNESEEYRNTSMLHRSGFSHQ
jgi:hypothetical protein